ncbi:MAG: nucleotidyltransferase family protein [Anaerolineae bacterium]|nr:nucleotidyltransferase family protein [Anaerolineae bacterium]
MEEEIAITEVLTLCLRGRWDLDAREAAAAELAHCCQSFAAWQQVAGSGGIAPLLYDVLRDRNLVAPEIESWLERLYYSNGMRVNGLLGEAREVLTALANGGIPVMVLKGLALAEPVYGNAALRPMTDLDFLIARDAAPRATAILRQLSYRPLESEARMGATLAYENEVLLSKNGDIDTLVELHWSLFDSPHYQQNLDMRWFWETARPAMVAGVPCRVLGPEAQLLHLAGHLLLHHGQTAFRLLWMQDIAEILVAYGATLDWDMAIEQAQRDDLVLSLQNVVPYVAERWRVPLPDGVLAKVMQLCPSTLETELVARLTAEARPVAQRFYTDLVSMKNWRHRLGYAWQNLFPTIAYIRQRYHVRHAALAPFFYPYRWLRGLWSTLGALLGKDL